MQRNNAGMKPVTTAEAGAAHRMLYAETDRITAHMKSQ